jgi:3-oxoacyl-[acyl-carrier protein] reductase
MTNETTLSGQAAVVTGSSSGIGRAIAIELANAGADLLVHARTNEHGAEEVAAQARSMGRNAIIVTADLSEPAQQDRLVEVAWNWRAIDIWVNNAGADVLTGEAANWAFDDKLNALWKVDVVATVRISRSVGILMRKRGHGVVLNMSWDQVESGMEGDSGQMFGAAKGAIAGATRSLAKSLAPEVRVNCIAPGWIQTKWGEHAPDEWQERAKRESLSGRWGTPEDVAKVACFLASPPAQFINGQVINVNGGRAC